MKTIFRIAAIVLIAIVNHECKTEAYVIKDGDGNIYDPVKIGNQTWLSENLKTTRYNDGTPIQLITDSIAWQNLTTPGYCWYNNDPAMYKDEYGALYNWNAVNTWKLCPTGWHVSTYDEWVTLTNYFEGWGGENVAGGKLKETGTIHWSQPNFGGTNETGFNALPGGERDALGVFRNIGESGKWWGNGPEYSSQKSQLWELKYSSDYAYLARADEKAGISVRCLYGTYPPCNCDAEPEVSTFTVSSVTPNTAIISGKVEVVPGFEKIISMGVCWNSKGKPTIRDKKTLEGSGLTLFKSNITGLKPDTKYYAFSYATNCYGTGYGNELSFTTGYVISDIEGNKYNVIAIGSQVWMAENLRSDKFNDGSDIPLVTDNAAWVTLTTPAYCWYLNDGATYKNPYGALYNWYTVKTGKLCPSGWHIPADEEWQILADYSGGISAGWKLKEAGTAHWESPNIGSTNESGFTGIGGGNRGSDGSFAALKSYGNYWSASSEGTTKAWYRSLNSNSPGAIKGSINSFYGFSVRCVKN